MKPIEFFSGEFRRRSPVVKFLVIDRDFRRRNSLSRELSYFAASEPLDNLAETRGVIPDHACVLVYDDGELLLEVVEYLKEQSLYCPIIPYHESPVTERVVDTLRSGFASYITWPCDTAKLQHTLEEVGQEMAIIQKYGAERARAERLLGSLTRRESDVFEGITSGQSSKEVARDLGISPRTVEIHRSNIFTKLKVRNAIAAVQLSSVRKLPDIHMFRMLGHSAQAAKDYREAA